jgi:hypothetical protein
MRVASASGIEFAQPYAGGEVSSSGPADRKALDAILERAAADKDFRLRLIADWRRTIHDSFGIAIPPNFNMRFVERDPGLDALIVLPDLRSADGELSDHELEHVAGGVDDDGSEWSDSADDAVAPW